MVRAYLGLRIKRSSAEGVVEPVSAKVKVKDQCHAHSFSADGHDLKNLYTKYELPEFYCYAFFLNPVYTDNATAMRSHNDQPK